MSNFRPASIALVAAVFAAAGGSALAQRAPASSAPKPFDVPQPRDVTIDPDAPPTPEAIKVMERELAKPRTQPGYKPPRLAFGQPDLQGVWTNASNTRLTRPGEFKMLVMNEEENRAAQAVHPQNVRQATDDNQKHSDGLLDGSDLAAGRGYNSFWIDPGRSYANVKGTWRTSWVVEPANGQIPLTEAGKKEMANLRGFQLRGTGYDNPEERGPGERCIIGLGGSAGPPLANSLYNNNYQIIQSPDHFVLVTEMNHDARVVRLNGTHSKANLNNYMGDSIGRWEGDTLVVETININMNGGSQIRLTPDGKVIERFTRYNDKQVLYEFEVHDPALYTKVWKGEMALNASPAIYEYACHEGNYGLLNILLGGRVADKRGVDIREAGDRDEM